jgi:hypothetical protein
MHMLILNQKRKAKKNLLYQNLLVKVNMYVYIYMNAYTCIYIYIYIYVYMEGEEKSFAPEFISKSNKCIYVYE